MNSKKEEFFTMLHLATVFFAVFMVAAYLFSVITNKEFIRAEFIGQALLITVFLFLGGLFGLTDIVLHIRSNKIRIAISGIVFYVISLLLLHFVRFNPLGNIAMFFAYTFLFTLAVLGVAVLFAAIQQKQSEKYMKCIKEFQDRNSAQ